LKQSEVIKEIKNGLYEKNISFLFGSGASMPFFKNLGNLEDTLTRLRKDETKYDSLIKLLYVDYFKKSIEGNIQILDDKNSCNYNVLSQYIRFIKQLSAIMNYRNDRISPKRANIFTTNYDVFFEKAIDIVQSENPSLILNDGAQGYFNRYLSSENFHKTVSRNGVFDNYHKELLSLNLIKCHGSVTWSLSEVESRIKIINNLGLVEKISELADEIDPSKEEKESLEKYLDPDEKESISDDELLAVAKKYDCKELENFSSTYKELLLINPEKSKFNHTVFEEHYYSMLRLLSYELERDGTLLIVFGFSFADEHILNLIKRSVHNPGLKIYIFSYDTAAARNIRQLLPNQNNIVIISPTKDDCIDFNEFNNLLFGGNLNA